MQVQCPLGPFAAKLALTIIGMDQTLSGSREQIVCRALEVIFREMDSPVTEESLAASVGYCSRHLRRTFIEATGESLSSFIRRIRLERAAGRLSLERQAIAPVAEEAQFLTTKAFSKAFHSHFECGPARFRELNSGENRLLPGFYLAAGRPVEELPTEVGIVTGLDALVTFQYDGLSLGTKFCPDGRVERRR